MREVKTVWLCAVGLVLCLVVIGCASSSGTFGRVRRQPPPGPTPTPAPSGPDLRIPEAPPPRAAKTNPDEIPLVPLPPLRGSEGTPGGRADTGPSASPPTSPSAPPPTRSGPSLPSPAPERASAPTEKTPTAREIYQRAQARYATLDSYIARFTRREVHAGKVSPEEVMLFKFRSEPFSVYMKWLGKEGHGREVIYVKGQHGDKLHTLLAAGDIPFVAAGRRMALSPDNVLVRNASRHSITDAGIANCLNKLGNLLRALERGDTRSGTLRLLPELRRPEYEVPVAAFDVAVPAGADENLPRGGRRLICFDPDTHLPQLIVTWDDRGQEVEYYRYDRLQAPVRLDADDFNPDRVWSKPPPKEQKRAGG